MLQSAKSGTAVVLGDNGVLRAVTVVKQTFETNVRSHLGYLSVVVSGDFLKRGSRATDTMIPRYINLRKSFLQCQPVRYFAIMLSRTSVAATVENTISLLSMIF